MSHDQFRDYHQFMTGHSDPRVADYHQAETAGLFDDSAMWDSYAAEPPAECYDANGAFRGDPGWQAAAEQSDVHGRAR